MSVVIFMPMQQFTIEPKVICQPLHVDRLLSFSQWKTIPSYLTTSQILPKSLFGFPVVGSSCIQNIEQSETKHFCFDPESKETLKTSFQAVNRLKAARQKEDGGIQVRIIEKVAKTLYFTV